MGLLVYPFYFPLAPIVAIATTRHPSFDTSVFSALVTGNVPQPSPFPPRCFLAQRNFISTFSWAILATPRGRLHPQHAVPHGPKPGGGAARPHGQQGQRPRRLHPTLPRGSPLIPPRRPIPKEKPNECFSLSRQSHFPPPPAFVSPPPLRPLASLAAACAFFSPSS